MKPYYVTKGILSRMSMGLSQHEVAAKLGVSQSLISLVERGLNDPDEEMKKKILELYKIKTWKQLHVPV